VRRPAAENERSVLHFHRETLDEGVHVAHVALRRGETSLFHHHTRTRDTFYVLGGRLAVFVRVPPGIDPAACYRRLTATEPTLTTSGAHHAVVLPGEALVIEPGVLHATANLDDAICRFICIEGVGVYDFIEEA
jgi:quercetin dioxygenase-like cupin family protein